MKPRIAIPIPTSFDPDYNSRSWPSYASAVERSGGEPVAIPLDQSPAETARLIASCSAVLLPGSGADVNPQKYGEQPDPAAAPPDPARENVDELLLQDAHNMGKPILTICFGTQMLNVWRGGSLIQDVPSALPSSPIHHKAGSAVLDAHPAQIPADSLLGHIVAQAEPSSAAPQNCHPERSEGPASSTPITLQVNSSHHQAIATPGDGLRVSALSPDDHVIEAIEGIPPAGQTSSLHHEPPPGAPSWSPFILGVQWHPERTFDHSATSRALFVRLIAEARAWAPRSPSV